ncbi:MAG: uracil-DNA glycosylase [Defluviitaleaceae bacterium]|nr:uracil-DNA glycosylase [Defluviitaleaceae bacterium]
MDNWDTLYDVCKKCARCPLWETRTNVVIGRGNKEADIMFIGEGPGFHEDQQGLPFVGPAGQLLDKMLLAINMSEENVYIANIVKCRPPGNRDPKPEEQAKCMDYLRYQLTLVRPKIIVALGRIAANAIIAGGENPYGEEFRITKHRGIWFERKGIQIMATYHPSALLRDETKKRPAWEDFKSIVNKL